MSGARLWRPRLWRPGDEDGSIGWGGWPFGGGAPPQTFKPPNNYPAAVLADNPIGYWKMNETSGTSAADSSGNGHTATITGTGLTVGQPGPFSDQPALTSFHFNHGCYLSTVLAAPTTQLTLEGWIEQDYTNFYGLAGWYNNGNCNAAIQATTSGWQYIFGNNPSDYFSIGTTTAGWHYVAATYDQSGTGKVTCYFDGASVGTMTANGPLGANTVFSLGSVGGGTSELLGYASNVAVYNYVLSATRIAAHWAAR